MHPHTSGYIALSMILIISAVILGITTTITYLSIGEAQTALTLTKGESTLAFVEECVDDVLLQARKSSSFASSPPSTLTEPEGTCTISKSGNNWTISTQATDYDRSIQVTFTSDGYGVTLTSWTEL